MQPGGFPMRFLSLSSLLVISAFSGLEPGWAADVHVTRCFGLDSQQKVVAADSFVLAKSIDPQSDYQELREVSGAFTRAFDGFRLTSDNFSVCKRPGLEKSKDFENSYEICGVSATLSPTTRGLLTETSQIAVLSRFNYGQNIPSLFPHLSRADAFRAVLNPQIYASARFRKISETNEVGMVAYYGASGKIDYGRTRLIQCRSESDRAIVVPGANH
jgi:hypothetical protein